MTPEVLRHRLRLGIDLEHNSKVIDMGYRAASLVLRASVGATTFWCVKAITSTT